MLSSNRSAIRIPVRLILSAYVGPMPRPVVPIRFLPRNRSVTLSRVMWKLVITCALAETTRSGTSTPRRAKVSISPNSAEGSITTPLAITGVQPGVSRPDGSRWVSNFSPLTTMVWPALFPPDVRTQ